MRQFVRQLFRTQWIFFSYIDILERKKSKNYWYFALSAKTTLLLKVTSNPLAASDCDVEGGSPLVFRPLSGENLIFGRGSFRVRRVERLRVRTGCSPHAGDSSELKKGKRETTE